jgi:hypothetical protein
MGAVLERIALLSPRKFENLVYDLLVWRGLKNVSWRTPGSDGGRDIEGTRSVIDFSGTVRHERWYVECKRYEAAIDWPTVYGKIAYAANHNADYLLLCTNSSVSPKCRDELALREAGHLRPFVRTWEGHELETLVASEPLLVRKYGLVPPDGDSAKTVLPLLWASSKSVGNAYAASAIIGNANPALEFAAAAAELAAIAADDLGVQLRPQHPFVAQRDLYDWCVLEAAEGTITAFHAYGLRAFLATMRLASGGGSLRLIETSVDGFVAALVIEPPPPADAEATLRAMRDIALVSDFEWTLTATAVQVRARSRQEDSI